MSGILRKCAARSVFYGFWVAAVVLIESIFMLTGPLVAVAPQANQHDSLGVTVRGSESVRSGEQINWQVVSGGGNRSISGSYILEGTAGQTTVGPCSTVAYTVNSGFWQNFGCCNVPGDANNSEAVNILDVSYLINYLYKGGPAPPCMPEGDADGSGAVNLLDVTRLINYLYKGGQPPVCGPDPWLDG